MVESFERAIALGASGWICVLFSAGGRPDGDAQSDYRLTDGSGGLTMLGTLAAATLVTDPEHLPDAGWEQSQCRRLYSQ